MNDSEVDFILNDAGMNVGRLRNPFKNHYKYY